MALDILIQTPNKFKKDLLEENWSRFSFDSRDRHLVTELVYGVIRHQKTLHHILQFYSKHVPKDIKVQNAAYLGLYQILFMERIPAYAAINTSVELLRKSNRKSAGYINAVLRKLLGQVQLIDSQTYTESANILPTPAGKFWKFAEDIFPDPKSKISEYRSIVHSYPHALVKTWERRFGSDTCLQLLRTGNVVAPIFLRPRIPMETAIQELTAQGIVPHIADNLIQIPHASLQLALAGITLGKWLVIGPSSAKVIQTLDVQPGMKVLDLCSAPGGKCIGIADILSANGSVTACDISQERLDILQKTVQKLNITNITTKVLDGRKLPAEFLGYFDRVLVDAPCSNTGVLARRPEARWRYNPENLAKLTQIQRELLDQAIKALKPDGILVYSTCSLEAEENKKIIMDFVEKNTEWECSTEHQTLPLPPSGDGGTVFSIKRKKHELV